MPWMLVYIAILVPFSTSNSFSQGAQSKPMHGRQTPSTFTHISSEVCVCVFPRFPVWCISCSQCGRVVNSGCHVTMNMKGKWAKKLGMMWHSIRIRELHLEPNPDWADLRHDWQGALYLLLHCHEEKLQANLVQYSAVISLLLSALSVLFRGVLRMLGKHWIEEYPWSYEGLVDWKIYVCSIMASKLLVDDIIGNICISPWFFLRIVYVFQLIAYHFASAESPHLTLLPFFMGAQWDGTEGVMSGCRKLGVALNISVTLWILVGNYGKIVDIFQCQTSLTLRHTKCGSGIHQQRNRLSSTPGSIELLGPGCLLFNCIRKSDELLLKRNPPYRISSKWFGIHPVFGLY